MLNFIITDFHFPTFRYFEHYAPDCSENQGELTILLTFRTYSSLAASSWAWMLLGCPLESAKGVGAGVASTGLSGVIAGPFAGRLIESLRSHGMRQVV